MLYPLAIGLNNHFIRGTTWYDSNVSFKDRDTKGKLLTLFTNKLSAALYAGIATALYFQDIYLIAMAIPFWLAEVIGRHNSIFSGKNPGDKNKTIDKLTRWIFKKVFDFNVVDGMLTKYWKLYGLIWVYIYSLLGVPTFITLNFYLDKTASFYLIPLLYPLIRTLIYGSVNLFYWDIVAKFDDWENHGRIGKKPLDYSLMYAEVMNGIAVGYLISLMA